MKNKLLSLSFTTLLSCLIGISAIGNAQSISAGFNFYGQLGIGNDTLDSVNHFVPMLFPQDVHQLRCVSSQGHFLLYQRRARRFSAYFFKKEVKACLAIRKNL